VAAIDVVRQIYATWQRGDQPWELLDEHIVWNCPMPDVPDENYRGHAGVAEFFRKWLGTWSDYEFRLDELTELPDGRVRARFWERGRGKGSGARVELRVVGHWTVAGGKAIRFDSEIEKESLA